MFHTFHDINDTLFLLCHSFYLMHRMFHSMISKLLQKHFFCKYCKTNAIYNMQLSFYLKKELQSVS